METGVIDQPAMEPESYWIKFPDNSILRRTRSMIKPRSQPSYFELEGKDWKPTGTIPPRYSNSFTEQPLKSDLPALPMSSPMPQVSTDRSVTCETKSSYQFHWDKSAFHHK